MHLALSTQKNIIAYITSTHSKKSPIRPERYLGFWLEELFMQMAYVVIQNT